MLLAFALGWVMIFLPLRQLLLRFVLYQAHKTIGLVVLALTVARLLVRARLGRPPHDEKIPAWQLRAARVMQVFLLLLLLVQPVLGYFTAATAPAPIPTLFFGVIRIPHVLHTDRALFAVLQPLHRALAVLLITLALGHALAALRHHRAGRATLTAMWRGRISPPPGAAPSAPDSAKEVP